MESPPWVVQSRSRHPRTAIHLRAEKIDDWRTYYNEARPHSALQWMTPAEFARQARESASPDNSTNYFSCS
ncbi:integrase core domain-containing protein [Burkholderia cepacia]|uniref:integrase core domain-containing protein n=1 Tax=Burkholderia cepacia TaxID=292 RepID=UPI0022AA202F|nr:integrase core domain-containing protein [Burkholderia cepacia]